MRVCWRIQKHGFWTEIWIPRWPLMGLVCAPWSRCDCHVFVTSVYIHSRANEDKPIVYTASNPKTEISNFCPWRFLSLFSGKDSERLSWIQYIPCPTRQSKMLDLCYSSIKAVFRASAPWLVLTTAESSSFHHIALPWGGENSHCTD